MEALLRTITLPTDIKFKARSLQESAMEYLRGVKVSIGSWVDQAQNAIADRLSHPTLRKQGLLATYSRLKQKEYRKVNAKELRAVTEFARNSNPESLRREELTGYYE